MAKTKPSLNRPKTAEKEKDDKLTTLFLRNLGIKPSC